jgi:hypothetical protein
VICHSSGGEPSPQNDGKAPNACCIFCAVATTAVALPSPIPSADRPMQLGSAVERLDAQGQARPWQSRSGTARAPPTLS